MLLAKNKSNLEKKNAHCLHSDNSRRRDRRTGSSSKKKSPSESTFNSKPWPHKHKQSNELLSKQRTFIMQNTANLMLLLGTQTVSNNSIKNSYPGPGSSEDLTVQWLPSKVHHAQSSNSSLLNSALHRMRIRKQSPSN